jgi:nitrate reductase alpha subunit
MQPIQDHNQRYRRHREGADGKGGHADCDWDQQRENLNAASRVRAVRLGASRVADYRLIRDISA